MYILCVWVNCVYLVPRLITPAFTASDIKAWGDKPGNEATSSRIPRWAIYMYMMYIRSSLLLNHHYNPLMLSYVCVCVCASIIGPFCWAPLIIYDIFHLLWLDSNHVWHMEVLLTGMRFTVITDITLNTVQRVQQYMYDSTEDHRIMHHNPPPLPYLLYAGGQLWGTLMTRLPLGSGQELPYLAGWWIWGLVVEVEALSLEDGEHVYCGERYKHGYYCERFVEVAWGMCMSLMQYC